MSPAQAEASALPGDSTNVVFTGLNESEMISSKLQLFEVINVEWLTSSSPVVFYSFPDLLSL